MTEDWRLLLTNAHALAWILPDWVPAPTTIQYEQELAGATVDLEWYHDQNNLVCMWMDEGTVAYAGIIDGKSSSGRTSQRGVISPELMTLLHGIVEKIRGNK